MKIAAPLLAALLLPCALLAAELPRAKPESVGMSSERLARIDAAMQRHIEAGDIVGAVTAVARRGKLVHLKAHGSFDLTAKSPMRTDAMFRMASSSKPVAAVAVLMMAEEGRLRLNDPVSMYIPELKKLRVALPRPAPAAGPGPALPGAKPEVDLVAPLREVTIRDLLTHTAGLMSGGIGQRAIEVARRPEETLAQYIPRLGEAALDFEPGSKWSYSPSAGIEVLSRIVEIVSGQSFDVFMRERIFKPLGMNSTAFVLSPEQQGRLPPLYRKAADGKWEIAPEPAQFISNVYFSGAAGLMGTVQDYLAFEQMRLNGGELNGARLLSPKSTQLMAMNHVGDLYRGMRGDEKGAGFGLAVAVTLDETGSTFRRSAGASGWLGAFGTIGWIDPQENLAAVMFIQQSNRATQVDFTNAVVQAIVQSDAPR